MAGGLSERDRAAVHQAAHVLVGWLVGIDAKAVTVADTEELGSRGATIADVPAATRPHEAIAMFAAGAVAERGFLENDDPNDWAEDVQMASAYLASQEITDPVTQANCFEAGITLAATLLWSRGKEWAVVAKALSEAGAMGPEKLGVLKGRTLVLGNP